jgi:hypothetical protein
VGLSDPVKKTPATEAERGIDASQFPEALPADDLFTGLLEENPANLASGGIKDELPELSPPGKTPGQKDH